MGMRRRRNSELSLSQEERDVPDVDVKLTRLIGYLKPYIPRLMLAVFALIISASLSLVFPAVIGGVGPVPGLLDTVLDEQSIALLDQITIILLGVFVLRSLSTFIETYNLNYIGERLVVDIRKALYEQLQRMSLKFFTDRRVGELVSRISSDVTVMRTALTNNLTTLLQQILILVGSVVIMFVINIRLSLFILVLIPIISAVVMVFGYYLRKVSTEVQDEIAGATVVAEEVMQNIREVKSFAREPYEVNRYDSAIDRAFKAAVKLLRIRSVFNPVGAFLGFGGLSLIVWFGGREVIEGRLTTGELIAFLIYGLSVAGSFGSLITLYSSFQEAIGAMKRVFQIMDLTPDIQDAPNAGELKSVAGRITFENVYFSYDERVTVLDNINLDIAPGEIVALVGPSGAGKSTTFNLIPRFYDVQQGALKIDGVDVREVTQASLRRQIGIVPQETLLFGGSIRENILYGRLDATTEEVIAAAQAANAHEFINEMPDGYDTIVGERGTKLSGGQRQRVAIARAILKDPRILLLDEATSSLDNESEYLVQEALGRLMQARTTVIIAHRLSTIRVAHRIAVINQGRIVELGTHDELMTLQGLYSKLYEMQFREEPLIAEGDAPN
ncbi:MAG: ABC transporter ATP-binding protein [Anaerolineae bacterium]